MTTTTQPETGTSWWRTAPNPPCEPWCVEDHEHDEFAQSGELVCSAFPFVQLEETHAGVVRVEMRRKSVGTDRRRAVEKQAIHVHLYGLRGDDAQLTAEEAQLLGAGLLGAAAFLKAVSA